MLLYLVRHALPIIDPSRHHYEWQLDPAGAERLAALSAWEGFNSAYRVASSSEPKALMTAEAIVRAHPDLPAPEPFDGLRELRKGGWAANHDEVMASVFARPDEPAAPGWESGAAALARFRASLDRLVEEAGGRDLIVVSHGTVLSFWLAWLRGQSRVDVDVWKAIACPDLAVVEVGTGRVVREFGTPFSTDFTDSLA